MINRERIIKKITGKKDFDLSSEIPNSYIFRKGLEYIKGLFRGYIKKIGMKNKNSRLFVGKKVKLLCTNKIEIGTGVRICNNCKIDALSISGVKLGDRVKIGDYSHIICSGSLNSLGKGLIVGNDTSFSEYTFFGAAGGVEIGSNVISGQNVRFHSENHKYDDREKLIKDQGVTHKGIKIGDNVWIGAGATFLDGSVVGNGCVVGANTVVHGKFCDNSVIAGIPAKVIKKIE